MWEYRYSDELYHYGVKGMKWGVRKKQDHKSGRTSNKKKDENKEKQKGLTDKQKKAIKIGAIAVASTLVVIGGYKVYKKYNGKSYGIGLDKQDTSTVGSSLKSFTDNLDDIGLNKKVSKSSRSIDLDKVNPNRSSSDLQYHTNCGNCSIAYELRRRGYDVEAKGNPIGMRTSHFGEFFNNLSSDSFTNVSIEDNMTKGSDIKKKVSSTLINKYPDDSRGVVFFTHHNGSHYFNWEKTKGEILYTDSQLNVEDISIIFDDYSHKLSRKNGHGGIECIRLDNAEINPGRIKSIVQNVGEKLSDNSDSNKFDAYVSIGENFVMKNH